MELTETIEMSPITLVVPSDVRVVGHSTIQPALPDGLEINEQNGEIRGTPTEVSPRTEYTISVMTTRGMENTTLVLEITSRRMRLLMEFGLVW